jgi:pimeloyl-ACP methyl ester carboxylesterase
MIININDVNIHYEEAGEGRTVIFLHGNSQDVGMFSEAVEYFKERYRCITVDSRGHGSSEWGTTELTIPLLADDMVKFIEAKDLRDITIIGFSDGGNIGLEAAAVSDRIKELIVVGANLYPKGLTTFTRHSVSVVRALCLPLCFIPSVRRTRRRYRLISHQPPITDDKLSKITARTLVIAGTKDMVKTSHTEEIFEKIPHASIKLFEGCGHFLFVSVPDELFRIMEGFMED